MSDETFRLVFDGLQQGIRYVSSAAVNYLEAHAAKSSQWLVEVAVGCLISLHG